MTDYMQLLRKAVDDHGQAEVARTIGYSASAVNQAIKGTYRGRLDKLLRRVAENYGNARVLCPVLGEITMRRCARERRKPACATSPLRARLYAACRECAVN